MAPRRTLCTHITSIITNSSTSGGALAAAGSTHARGRAHTVRGYLLNSPNPGPKSPLPYPLSMVDYNTCATSMQPVFRDQVNLRSRQHTISTVKQHRRCLSAYDDKRFILECGTRTLAYGHYSIPQRRRMVGVMGQLRERAEAIASS